MRALGMAAGIADALQLYQRNRLERTARIVNNSGLMRTLYHSRDQATLRKAFAGRNEGGDRNAWLYSYNPLTVPLA
jgi:salicylate hydroxylase